MSQQVMGASSPLILLVTQSGCWFHFQVDVRETTLVSDWPSEQLFVLAMRGNIHKHISK